VALLSEDIFRYHAHGTTVRPQALLDLLTRLRRIPGLGLMQVDHANLFSVAGFSDEQLRAARELLAGASGVQFLWLNVGVETAAGELLASSGGTGKMHGLPAAEWGEFCRAQVLRLIRAGFFPLVSLMVGLPKEEKEHVRRTREWVEALQRERLAIFPLLYAPTDGSPGLQRRDLRRAHWELIRACYRLNFRWVPRLYLDNQEAAGVPAVRRMLTKFLGRGQALRWSGLLALRAWRSRI
jgi:radical SAM superfamily enzyme YgiQ (UPF0313 family)